MKKWFPGWLAFLVFGSQTLFAQQPVPGSTPDDVATQYAATITAGDLSRHLRVIASDSLEGRGTGEIGQKMAADYLAGEFFEYGLKPVISRPGGVDTYYQSFHLFRRQLEEVSLTIAEKALAFPADFLPLGKGSVEEHGQASLVFSGYQVEGEVKDKVVFLFLGEPRGRGRRSSNNRGKTLAGAIPGQSTAGPAKRCPSGISYR
jgi:hypothetical protein